MMGKTSSKVKDRYNAKAYDELKIRIPKDQKATIQAAADKEGESINSFVNKAVMARIGLEDWPEIDRED